MYSSEKIWCDGRARATAKVCLDDFAAMYRPDPDEKGHAVDQMLGSVDVEPLSGFIKIIFQEKFQQHIIYTLDFYMSLHIVLCISLHIYICIYILILHQIFLSYSQSHRPRNI